ncbi:MAG: hypothetical protein AAF580_11970 [Pseudomonadota bacterium]
MDEPAACCVVLWGAVELATLAFGLQSYAYKDGGEVAGAASLASLMRLTWGACVCEVVSMLGRMVLGAGIVASCISAGFAEEPHRHGEHGERAAAQHGEKAHNHEGLEPIADEVADVAAFPDGPEGMTNAVDETIEAGEEDGMCPWGENAVACQP